MAKTYHIKLTGSQAIDVPESDYRLIENDIYQRADKMIRAAGVMFSARDVRRVSSSYEYDQMLDFTASVPEISDEQQAINLRRMRWLRARFFPYHSKAKPILADEQAGYDKWVAWYAEEPQVQRRAKRQAFHHEYFDTYFVDANEVDACFQSWLKATDPHVDPRSYHRENHTPQALGFRTSDIQKARDLFGVTTVQHAAEGVS
ncbi:MAG: hypothetical protein ACR2KZ_07390 [Segetibacter sp.]